MGFVFGHGGAMLVDYGFEFGLLPGVDFFAVVHQLKGEGVFVQDYAGDYSSLPCGDSDEFVGGRVGAEIDGDEALGELGVGFADRFDEVFARARGADAREIGAEAAALSLNHVALGASGGTEEKFVAGFWISGGGGLAVFLQAAEVGDDFAGGGLVDIVSGHGGAGDAVEDAVKNGVVGRAVGEMAGDEAGSAKAAVGVDAVAVGAVDAEIGFAGFDGIGVGSGGFLLLEESDG